MATVTTKLTLSSTDLTTDSLDVAITKQLTIAGPSQSFRMAIDSSSSDLVADHLIAASASYTKSYILLHNTATDASHIISIGDDTNGDATLEEINIVLGAGEWCWFPWDSTRDLVADAAAGTPVLSVMVMQVAA